MATLIMIVLAWQVGLGCRYYLDYNVEYQKWFRKWMGCWTLADEILSPILFLGLWGLYGFCFGQFFGQVASRPIIAAILAAATTPLVVGLWIPSLFFGGVPAWQFLAIPIILLATTRLGMWPWISGRLSAGKPFLGMAGAVGLVISGMAGFLWDRAFDVPALPNPFNVNPFFHT